MILKHKILLSSLLAILFFSLSMAPASSASGIPHTPQVQVYSSLNNTNQYLFIPLNSSGLNAYPEWHISIFSSQNYELYVNGNLTENGIGPITLLEGFYQYKNVSVQVKVGNTVYSFTDENIIGSQPTVNVQSVSAVSSYRGQNQQLTALPGESGQLMYSNWTITLKSGSNETYVVYEGKNKVDSGYVLGTIQVSLNISKGPVTVTVGLGSKTYVFSNELIATVPLKQYYSPPKPPLVATEFDIALSAGLGVMSFAVFVIVAMLTVRPWTMDRMKRKPRQR